MSKRKPPNRRGGESRVRANRKPTRRISGQTLFLGAAIVVSCLVLGYLAFFGGRPPRRSELTLEEIPFGGARAYEYLKQLCDIGPRPSGSTGMTRQQELLAEHFRQCGAEVELQRFTAPHPKDGSDLPMANLIARWHPEREERILLCAHYDTLPLPMLDPEDPEGTFVGANDGASGVAVLMELAHEMPDLPCRYGVDFVLFDGEEFIFDERDTYFHGSRHFARQYADGRLAPARYRWGVLLDMIGDKDLQVYQERHSMQWNDTRPLVEQIWAIAERLGVREFVPVLGDHVRDDHVPLHELGKIPCIDVIDFEYPSWHTQADVPSNCSALSLAKVGWVLREWLVSAE